MKKQWFLKCFEQNESNLIRFAYKILKNEESAREITQEAFVKLWNKFDHETDAGHESQWLYTVVRNACYDVLRKNKKVHLSVDDLEAEIPDVSSNAEQVLSENQQKESLLKKIAQLTDIQREVLQLKFGENKSHQEISQLTGMSANHIGVFVFNIVKKLKQMTEREGLNEITKR